MKVLIDIKIKYFVLLLIIIAIGCASTRTQTRISTTKPEKYKSVWCSSLETSGHQDGFPITSPVGINDGTFTTGNGKNVILYTTWYDLEPRTTVTFRWEVYQPNGEIVGSVGDAWETNSTSHSSHFRMELDDKHNRVPGVWTVKTFVNNYYIFTEQFTILED